jgi:flagellar basal-body rod protein FlgC
MSFFSSLDVSASGLTAQRLRMDIISENIANVETTRTADGSPYKRKTVLFQERGSTAPFSEFFKKAFNGASEIKGVRVTNIVEDQRPGTRVYDPGHPDADGEGYVTKPNVNIVEEMVNMISASRSYEANMTAMNTTKSMIAKTLEMGAR